MEPLGAALSPSQASRTQGALSANEQMSSAPGLPSTSLPLQSLLCLLALRPHSLPAGIPRGGSPALNALSPAWGPSRLQVGTPSLPEEHWYHWVTTTSAKCPNPTKVERLAPFVACPGSGP